MLYEVCATRIRKITSLLEQITYPENERITAIRQRLEEGLAKIAPAGGYDNSRLEQEMIFYIEKLDINEEKSRLASHRKSVVRSTPWAQRVTTLPCSSSSSK